MIRTTKPSAAVARVQRLVGLYQARAVTIASLIDQIAELVTSDNIEEVVELLPPEVKAQLTEWARRLPLPDEPGIICWPLPERTTEAFSAWLKAQEDQERQTGGGR